MQALVALRVSPRRSDRTSSASRGAMRNQVRLQELAKRCHGRCQGASRTIQAELADDLRFRDAPRDQPEILGDNLDIQRGQRYSQPRSRDAERGRHVLDDVGWNEALGFG